MRRINKAKAPDVRRLAVQLLQRVLAEQQGISLRAALQQPQVKQLSASDRGLLYDLCFGVCRHRRLLNHWLEQQMAKPLKPSAEDIRLLLCCGIYELWFSKRPAHAVVNAWPSLCRRLRKPWASGLTNALLRKASGFDWQSWRANLPPAVASSLPDWLYQHWSHAWPEQLAQLIDASLQEAPMTLRNNRLQQSRETLQQQFEKAGIDTHAGKISEHSLYLQTPVSVVSLPGFSHGSCSVQDEAAQLPTSLFTAMPLNRLLDACAAPGGKTGQLCEQFPDTEVTALDVDNERLQKVADNLQRLGVSAKLAQGDATSSDWWDGDAFDAILLDAPCSASGIIRRQPDSKWHKQADDIVSLAGLQSRLLDNLWTLLKPGGCLVYATCSILPEENAKQISDFLQRHPDASEDTPDSGASVISGPGCQLLPQVGGWDGFYFARLHKA